MVTHRSREVLIPPLSKDDLAYLRGHSRPWTDKQIERGWRWWTYTDEQIEAHHRNQARLRSLT